MATTANPSFEPRSGARSLSPKWTSTSGCNGTASATSKPSCPGIGRWATPIYIRIDLLTGTELDRSTDCALPSTAPPTLQRFPDGLCTVAGSESSCGSGLSTPPALHYQGEIPPRLLQEYPGRFTMQD